MLEPNGENKDGHATHVDVSISGMHVVSVPAAQVADNPLSPDKQLERKPTNQSLVISPDNRYLIDTHTGDVAENPLDINDPVKRDNVAVMQRKTSIWLAHAIVFGSFLCVAYGQMICTPVRDFSPPVELWGIVLGIYGASSTNFITKVMAVRASLKRKT